MRIPVLVLLFTVVVLAACASGSDKNATLVLQNPEWDRVHVEAVVTKSGDCSSPKSYIATHKFVMTKGETHKIKAPNAEDICWRHDSNPNSPAPGAWSGWSRATMFPGQTITTDL
jgi:hypothetical protein